MSLKIKLEYLNESDVTRICSDYGVSAKRELNDDDDDENDDDDDDDDDDKTNKKSSVYVIRNSRTFGLSEKDIVLDCHGCAQELLQKDREAERRGRRAAAAEGRQARAGAANKDKK